jgi:hypothetical protein
MDKIGINVHEAAFTFIYHHAGSFWGTYRGAGFERGWVLFGWEFRKRGAAALFAG